MSTKSCASDPLSALSRKGQQVARWLRMTRHQTASRVTDRHLGFDLHRDSERQARHADGGARVGARVWAEHIKSLNPLMTKGNRLNPSLALTMPNPRSHAAIRSRSPSASLGWRESPERSAERPRNLVPRSDPYRPGLVVLPTTHQARTGHGRTRRRSLQRPAPTGMAAPRPAAAASATAASGPAMPGAARSALSILTAALDV
jgi:hypothetical protein